jgi:nitroreductase
MERVSSVLGLPEQVTPYALIALGYPKASKQATPRYDESRVHFNRY